LAAVLAAAVRAGELDANYALRVLRHQLRVMNVNRALKAPVRSVGAQAVIDRYNALGSAVPKNGSGDALHCDHVHPLTADDLVRVGAPAEWLVELERATEVVCVTAAENYALERVERDGVTGWEKYAAAGLELLRLPVSAGPL
jgi:hypothetical protein